MTYRRPRIVSWLAGAVALACAGGVTAQTSQSQHLTTPMASPYAEVAQRIGLTDVRVTYHRPAANGRDVWKTVVFSAGPIWRTGANENTTVSFSTDVTVQGKALAAGTYGLHTIPGDDEWTIIFSGDHHAWGSYAYDEANDAVRVTASPRAAPHHERFTIDFDNLSSGAADLVLAWAEVEVPVTIAIDEHATVLADYRSQLTGLTQFFWQGWNQAAQYGLNNDVDLEEALTWADRSIQAEERFENLQTKAGLLRKLERTEEADAATDRALDNGTARQVYGYARGLQQQGRNDEAMALYKSNAKRHPDDWIVPIGLARMASAEGDFAAAIVQVKKAMEKMPANLRPQLQPLLEKLEAGNDIN